MDSDSIKWCRRFLLLGLVTGLMSFQIGRWSVDLRPFSVIPTLAAFFFLVDFKGSRKFRLLYWNVIIIWLSLLTVTVASIFHVRQLYSVSSYFGKSAVATVPTSIILFALAMRTLATDHALEKSIRRWTTTVRVTSTFFGPPALVLSLGFLAVYAGFIDRFWFFAPEPESFRQKVLLAMGTIAFVASPVLFIANALAVTAREIEACRLTSGSS